MTTTETRRMNASVAGIAVAWMMANTPSVATIPAPSMTAMKGWMRTVSSRYTNGENYTTDGAVASEWVRLASEKEAERKEYEAERNQYYEDIRNGVKEQVLNEAGYPYNYPTGYDKFGYTSIKAVTLVDLTAHADHWAEYDRMLEQSPDGAPTLYFP